MVEDKLLIQQLKCGSAEALEAVYDKYSGYLLSLATALLTEISDAEDALQDALIALVKSAHRLRAGSNLKSYLATCVANKARDMIRMRNRRRTVNLDAAGALTDANTRRPDATAICNEQSQQVRLALGHVPYQQREVIVLHVNGGLTFRQIAELQAESVNTVQGRYRYGMDKLRLALENEVQNEISG